MCVCLFGGGGGGGGGGWGGGMIGSFTVNFNVYSSESLPI